MNEEQITPEESEQAKQVQAFLEFTKEKFDKYFENMGYVCMVFNKENHKGESAMITNSPNDVLGILEPYANAKEIALSKARRSKIKGMRRI